MPVFKHALAIILLSAFTLSACHHPADNRPGSGETQFKVIGYSSINNGNYRRALDVQLPYVTHINIAFANPTDDASGAIQSVNGALIDETVERAHALNKEVFISFGGWRGDDSGYDLVYERIAANDEARSRFIHNILAFVARYQLDGVDMDWEYPRLESADDYEGFIVELSQALHAKGKQLSAAVIGTKNKVTDDGDAGAYSDKALAAFDWLNLMTYDDRPDNHSPYDLVERSLAYWVGERHIPNEKAMLGLPAYARPSWRSYADIVKQNPAHACVDSVLYQGKQDYYNGLSMIEKKTNFARQHGLGGVMVWELPLDSTIPELSIMKTIYDSLHDGDFADPCAID
ncbi:glycosyl hydrolase family 18 protein [Alteromonas sp. 14N.309.X.WAT.G.H12]|uniref:glycosyl hydrolase family 18 protein n=1 Tax=Alteromonas sp. 14N.309.X.WAT.G.H12 TaxID=3120824 RepID=UPI002FD4A56F